MPLLLNKQIDEISAYSVWNIQESFFELPYLYPDPFPVDMHSVRRAEWIIGRILVKNLCANFNIRYQGVDKDDKGKPYLIGSDVHISISHSFPIAVAMIHRKSPCGIDVEKPRNKHKLVHKKYLHEEEIRYKDDVSKLCTIWSAKEVIYKIYGKKSLSFKNEIRISFESDELLKGHILKKGEENSHLIHYELVKDYLLVYGA